MEYSLCLFNAKLVSYALLFWLPFYAKNNKIGGKCLGDYEATALAALFNVGFMISSVIIGGLSDLLNSRAVASMLFLVLSVPSLFLYREFGSVSVAVSGLLTLLVGVCVNGAYSVISTAVPIDLGNHKTLKSNQKAVSTISGIIDGTGSIGAAIGPFLVGWIVDSYGWNAVFYFLMVCFFLAALAIFRIFIVDVIKGVKNLKERYTKCRSPSAFQELNLHEFPAGVEMSDEHNSGDDPVPFSVRKQKGNGGLTGDTTITSSEETNL
jgi:OPA family glycerol-3-phosphate transporter-like MFS transporter 1/2